MGSALPEEFLADQIYLDLLQPRIHFAALEKELHNMQ